jgi:DNA (cytosine-5)-methyltransferase 1
MRVLDLFSGAGGCSEGYRRGGFEVIGVDSAPLKEQYVDPENFYQLDVMEILDEWAWNFGHYHLPPDQRDGPLGAYLDVRDFDVIHASPPCQGYSATKRFNPGIVYPKLIEPVRDALRALQMHDPIPYVMENVETAPLYATVTLCGGMFPAQGLKVYRHRIFETNFHIPQPIHNPHVVPQAKMGRPPKDGEFMHVVGHFPSMGYAKAAMGIDWMRRNELAEAIPPAYTEYIAPYAMAAALEHAIM